MEDWYYIKNVDEIDSPSLVIYRERVAENIRTAISIVQDVKRLRPHVKTHKCAEVVEMMLREGITKFKCATIAEAEMLAACHVEDVLLAYQPQGPKIERLIQLIIHFPETTFSCLADNLLSAKIIASYAEKQQITVPVFIDINAGMDRTGIEPGERAVELYKALHTLNGVHPAGLHAYDGHVRNQDLEERTQECNNAFDKVARLKKTVLEYGLPTPVVIAGGSPTFPIHAERKDVECSPGTFVFWDQGYLQLCPEQNFKPAALVISRINSKPGAHRFCLDAGHKSVASENALDKRLHFLNAPDLQMINQSEEHLVIGTKNSDLKVGDVLYGMPWHICPTVALYERAYVVDDNKIIDEWKIIARDRKIKY